MGFFNKVKKLADSNKDRVADGVDRATDVVDSKTGRKHTDRFDKIDDAADRYAGRGDSASLTDK